MGDDQAFIRQLQRLQREGREGGIPGGTARDELWDLVSQQLPRILRLAAKGAKPPHGRRESARAYNSGEISRVEKDVIGSVEMARLAKLPAWAKSLIHNLVQRIANLRSQGAR